MCQCFSTTEHLGSAVPTLAKKKKKPKTSIILGYTLAWLVLRDRKSASEKYMIDVVRQNTFGGGHNATDCSNPLF